MVAEGWKVLEAILGRFEDPFHIHKGTIRGKYFYHQM